MITYIDTGFYLFELTNIIATAGLKYYQAQVSNELRVYVIELKLHL